MLASHAILRGSFGKQQHYGRVFSINVCLLLSLYTPCLKKLCQCYFLNNSVNHWPMLIILACNITKKLDVNDYTLYIPPHVESLTLSSSRSFSSHLADVVDIEMH